MTVRGQGLVLEKGEGNHTQGSQGDTPKGRENPASGRVGGGEGMKENKKFWGETNTVLPL